MKAFAKSWKYDLAIETNGKGRAQVELKLYEWTNPCGADNTCRLRDLSFDVIDPATLCADGCCVACPRKRARNDAGVGWWEFTLAHEPAGIADLRAMICEQVRGLTHNGWHDPELQKLYTADTWLQRE